MEKNKIGNIYYVDKNSKIDGSGKSFKSAFKNISDAQLHIKMEDLDKKGLKQLCWELKKKNNKLKTEINLNNMNLWELIIYYWKRKEGNNK